MNRTRHRRRRRSSLPAPCLALASAILLLGPTAMLPPCAQAQDATGIAPAAAPDVGTVLASRASTQAVALLVANPARVASGRRCFFDGAVRIEERVPGETARLDDVGFEPLRLAPGESLAIDIPPPDGAVVPSQVRVLVMAIEPFDAGSAACALTVQAVGYEPVDGATEVMLDRYTFGFEKAPPAAVSETGPQPFSLPLGFVGGNADQAARLVLLGNSPGVPPEDRCDLPSEVVAWRVPRLAEAWTDSTRSFERAWPIRWDGPALSSLGIADIDFAALLAPGEPRVDLRLSLRFDQAVPLACLKALDGSLEILDLAGGKTRAAIPTDRLFFNYHHFHN